MAPRKPKIARWTVGRAGGLYDNSLFYDGERIGQMSELDHNQTEEVARILNSAGLVLPAKKGQVFCG